MAQVQLECKPRDKNGKGNSRRLRAEGRVPGILYGPTLKDAIALDLEEKALLTLIQQHGVNPIINLQVAGKDSHLCMIKDLQKDVYQTHFLHVDLRKVDMSEKIEVHVKLVLEGEDAVRAAGAVVEQTVRTVNVRTTPTNIPDHFTADISHLRPGKSISLSQVELPAGVELAQDGDMPIVHVFAPRGTVLEETEA